MRRSNGHRFCLLIVACLCAAFAGAQRASPRYTIAFKSYAPNNTDIFIADSDGNNARPLMPDPALDYNASFSPDGQWIVFTSNRSGSSDIYRVHADGKDLERLTDDPAFDDQGALSPNGKSLAFVSSRSGQADVWILDLATHRLRNITRHPAGDFRPAWSPDGQWLAFSSDRNPARTSCPNTTEPGPGPFVTPQFTSVYMVRPDGSDLRRITDSNELAGMPRWSPDGSSLVFYTAGLDEVCKGGLIFGTGASQITRVELKTGKRETMTAGTGLKVSPRWLDATRIAYGTRSGIQFTGGGSTLSGDFQSPDWSPDRRTMVFHRETDRRGDRDRDFRLWPSPDPQFDLLRVPGHASFSPTGNRMVYLITNIAGDIRNGSLIVSNANGTDRKAIYEGPVSEDVVGPTWSPRGETIIFGLGGFFQRAQIKNSRLMSIHSDGTGLAPITQGRSNDGMPSWSPDGKQVVYRVANETRRWLEILEVSTGKTRKLETASSYDTFPSWSPNGDWITFTSKRDEDYEIYRIRPNGTGLQRLTHSPGADAHPSFSPDGQWIAFATGRQGFKDEAVQLLLSPTFQPYGEIAVMHADGSGVRILTDNSTEEGAPSWIPRSNR